MKVLVINGSPRAKGNSDLLCDEFIRGAQEAGHQVEKISLREIEIAPCRACYACFRTGICVQKDDMAEILDKAEATDVLLLASPTYFLTMSGQMKVMIDRLLPKWQGLGGKEAYVIVTGHDGRGGLKRNADDLAQIQQSVRHDFFDIDRHLISRFLSLPDRLLPSPLSRSLRLSARHTRPI